MENFLKVDFFVQSLASTNFVKSFYPIAVSKSLCIPVKDVIDGLNYLVKGGALNLKYEIKCNDDLTIIKRTDEYSSILGKSLYCPNCNQNIVVEFENIYPLYYINDDYREMIKKNELQVK